LREGKIIIKSMKKKGLFKKELLQKLKKEIKKGFGPPCKDFNFYCMVCQAWMAYNILENLFED